MQNHGQASLQDYPTSTFFNLATTLNAYKTKMNLTLNKSDHNPNGAFSSHEDFYVYQCLNCHHFFPSNCSFSHNCWTYTENNVNDADQKQPSTNNNYFSPIFFKFNVTKVLSTSLSVSCLNSAIKLISNCNSTENTENQAKRIKLSS